MIEIVYEDDELQAFWLQGQSQYAVISFGDLISLADGETFSILAPASKLGLTCLGIMAKRPNWYPRANLERLWSAVAARMEPFQNRLLYGASMGGHGAIKSSALMGATTTVALCPQWSINPDDATVDLGWAEYFNHQLMTGMAISASDLDGKVFILSDPGEKRDEFHRQKLQALSRDVIAVDTHFCDHNVTPVLSGTNNLQEILTFCQDRDTRALSALVNKVRRPHFFRKKALIERGLSKKPALTVKAVLRLVEKDALVKEIVLAQTSQVLRLAERYAGQNEWNHFVISLIHSEGDLLRKFNLTMLLRGNHKVKFSLITTFGTEVAYDPSENRLVHTTAEERDRLLLSVKLFMHNDKLEIFAENEFCRLSLPELKSLESPSDNYFEPVKVGGDRIALRRNGLFLSADPNGLLSCDRLAASEWEFFKLLVTSDQGSNSQTEKSPVPAERKSMAYPPFWSDEQNKNGITIGAIAKNEQRYLPEWIAYHFAIGVDRIVVYSNDTEDQQNDLLDKIAKRDSRFEWRDWPSISGVSPQISAYQDAVKRASTPWVAFVDVDEFLVPTEDDTIQDYLSTIPDDVSTVHVNWRGFGSGGQETDDYELVTRTFMMASPVRWGNNHHFKSIGRTLLAHDVGIHNIIASSGRRTLSDFEDFETVNNGIADRIVHHRIQINHYQCKSYPEFAARMRRGLANVPLDHPERARDGGMERFRQLDLNDERNEAIRRFDSRVDEEYALISGYLK